MPHLEPNIVWCWNRDTLKMDQKHLECSAMWYWRGMERNQLNRSVRIEEVLHSQAANEYPT
jgi:hypothetical protein